MMYFYMRGGSTIEIERDFDTWEIEHMTWLDDRSWGTKGVIGIAPELVDAELLPEIGFDDMKPGHEFNIGPFRLRCLGYSQWERAYLARRIDD
jgi:hypothetical protein